MENANEKIIDHLNHLITICNDGKYGYETAAEDADSAALRSTFIAHSTERRQFADALKAEVIKLGGDPDKGGGPVGALHRAWIDVKTALSSDDNKAVLSACMTGDTAAVNAYDEVLNDTVIPAELRVILNNQRREVEDALREITVLHNTIE